MITRKLVRFDNVAKLEIVSFKDLYGTEQIIQHPLTQVGYDPDAVEAAVVTAMQANEDKWTQELAKRAK